MHTVASPDGNIKVDIKTDKGITYDVTCHGELVLDDCRLSMNIEAMCWGPCPKYKVPVAKA